MTHLDIEAKNTRSAAGQGSSIDISGITADWTLVVEVYGVDSGVTGAIINFETSADGFSSDLVFGPAASFVGPLGSDSPTNSATDQAGHSGGYFVDPKRYTWRKGDFPALRAGVTSAHIKSGVALITGSGSITYATFLEY